MPCSGRKGFSLLQGRRFLPWPGSNKKYQLNAVFQTDAEKDCLFLSTVQMHHTSASQGSQRILKMCGCTANLSTAADFNKPLLCLQVYQQKGLCGLMGNQATGVCEVFHLLNLGYKTWLQTCAHKTQTADCSGQRESTNVLTCCERTMSFVSIVKEKSSQQYAYAISNQQGLKLHYGNTYQLIFLHSVGDPFIYYSKHLSS